MWYGDKDPYSHKTGLNTRYAQEEYVKRGGRPEFSGRAQRSLLQFQKQENAHPGVPPAGAGQGSSETLEAAGRAGGAGQRGYAAGAACTHVAALASLCWSAEPKDRPTFGTVANELQKIGKIGQAPDLPN